MHRFILPGFCALLTGCATCPPTHLNITGGTTGAALDSHMLAYLGPKARITTNDNLLFHIVDDEPKANYWVLFGPNPGSKNPATGGRHNSRTTFDVASGYALYWGVWPIGTDGVEDTSADGTTFVTQSDGQIHRSYLLSNHTGRPVHVYLTGTEPASGKIMTVPGTYIEVIYPPQRTGKLTLSDPRKTDAPPETRDFIAAVKAAALAAGFPASELE